MLLNYLDFDAMDDFNKAFFKDLADHDALVAELDKVTHNYPIGLDRLDLLDNIEIDKWRASADVPDSELEHRIKTVVESIYGCEWDAQLTLGTTDSYPNEPDDESRLIHPILSACSVAYVPWFAPCQTLVGKYVRKEDNAVFLVYRLCRNKIPLSLEDSYYSFSRYIPPELEGAYNLAKDIENLYIVSRVDEAKQVVLSRQVVIFHIKYDHCSYSAETFDLKTDEEHLQQARQLFPNLEFSPIHSGSSPFRRYKVEGINIDSVFNTLRSAGWKVYFNWVLSWDWACPGMGFTVTVSGEGPNSIILNLYPGVPKPADILGSNYVNQLSNIKCIKFGE